MIFLTALIFIGLLLALVLVHEWGHFIAAKRAGCNVEEFGFGFPPRLFAVMYHGTRYSLNLLPIGGFVKIEGEDMQSPNPGPTNFASKSPGWRAIILAAGVAMNVVLAVILLTVQGIIGYPTLATAENKHTLSDHQTYILDVAADSPAAAADLKPYDRIVRVADFDTPTIEQVQTLATTHAGQPLSFLIDRQGVRETKVITPRSNPPANEGGLGISLVATGLERVPWWQAPIFAVKRTGQMLAQIVIQFYLIIQRLATSGSLNDTLTGPIGIAIYTNEAANLGASYILELGALISLNLAIINILPLPALDGGRILFVGIEKIRGRRLPEKAEQLTHTIGFALLILLMLAITFKDIKRFF